MRAANQLTLSSLLFLSFFTISTKIKKNALFSAYLSSLNLILLKLPYKSLHTQLELPMATPLPSSEQQQQQPPPPPSSSPPIDVEAAVRELTKGHELASELHSLLREVIPRGDGRLESACRMSMDVQQTLLSALSILRPTRKARFRSSDPLALQIRLPCSESEESHVTTAAEAPDFDPDDRNQKHTKKRNLCSGTTISYETSNEGHCKTNGEKKTNKSKVQRNHLNSWTTITCTPFNDGHQWRKYGEKKISNCKMPRCYYRCTHKDDQDCQATKQVQQKDNEDPPKYVVTYNKQHTCKKIDLLMSEEFVIEGGKFVIEPPPPITDPCQLSL